MVKQEAIEEIEAYLRGADKATSEDAEYIRGWKSALLVALEIVTQIDDVNDHLAELKSSKKYKV